MSASSTMPPMVEWPAWPSYGLEDDLLPTLRRWAETETTIAIAVLVDIQGSSPRPLGSEMAITPDGRVVGYVSGGCVEGAVAMEARDVIRSGTPKLLDYGAGSPVLDVQLTCGGRIGIYIYRVGDLADYVATRRAHWAARTELYLEIDRRDGGWRFRERVDDAPGADVFRQHYPPPPRLILVGGDPVTLAVAQQAGQLGMEIGLLRPYGPSAPPPGLSLGFYDTRALSSALADLSIDSYTALYSLTHDMDDDESVLRVGLASPAFRLGVLGSRRKADERRARLAALGHDEAALARIEMPAGIEVAASNPREIALSIVAGVVAARPRAAPQAGRA